MHQYVNTVSTNSYDSSSRVDPAEAVFRGLLRTLGLLRRAMEPHFARFGISGPQWGVLRSIHRAAAAGETVRPTDLGRRLLIRPPSVTGVIDRLVKSGLVARAESIADRREKRLELTRAGAELVARVLEHHPSQIRRVMSGLDALQQAALDDLLRKLGTHLAAISDDPAARPADGGAA